MPKIKIFPQIVFITIEEDGESDYMLPSLTKQDALNDEPQRVVGMYQFVGSETVRQGNPIVTKRKSRKTS